MNTYPKTTQIEDIKAKLSTLWMVVMLNIAFADIVGFMNPGALENIMKGSVGFNITQELLLVFSVLLEIPIAMIFLSRILKPGANRWANIIASAITTVFVIGGGNTSLSYIFFATIEIAAMLVIVWYAWKLPQQEASANPLTPSMEKSY